ncbi:unnamed protein product [Prunus armeniaca]
MLVADYKETKSTVDKLEKHIEELHKQLAGLREKQNKLGAEYSFSLKTYFRDCRSFHPPGSTPPKRTVHREDWTAGDS